MRKNLVFVLFLFSILCSGQNRIDGYAISSKLGVLYSSGVNDGLAGGIEVSLLKKSRIYSLVFSGGGEFITFALPREEMNFLDVLYGGFKDFNNHLFRIQYQGGIGAVWGVKRGQYLYSTGGTGGWFNLFSTSHHERLSYFNIGLPIKIGFKIIPLRQLSIGIDILANINTESPSFMPMISLEFGKLKAKKLK